MDAARRAAVAIKMDEEKLPGAVVHLFTFGFQYHFGSRPVQFGDTFDGVGFAQAQAIPQELFVKVSQNANGAIVTIYPVRIGECSRSGSTISMWIKPKMKNKSHEFVEFSPAMIRETGKAAEQGHARADRDQDESQDAGKRGHPQP